MIGAANIVSFVILDRVIEKFSQTLARQWLLTPRTITVRDGVMTIDEDYPPSPNMELLHQMMAERNRLCAEVQLKYSPCNRPNPNNVSGRSE